VSEFETDQAVAEPGIAAEPEAPAEPVWSGPSQEEWQETREALQYLASQQQAAPQQQPQQEQGPPEIDFFADDAQAQMDAYIEAKLAPYADYTQQAILSEAEARAQDILKDVTSREGDFLFEGSFEKARALANTYVPQMAQKHGYGPAAAEHAIEQAYKDTREWEDAVGKAYHERQLNQLGNLGGARQEPGAAGSAAAQQFVIPGGGDEMDVVARYTHGRS